MLLLDLSLYRRNACLHAFTFRTLLAMKRLVRLVTLLLSYESRAIEREVMFCGIPKFSIERDFNANSAKIMTIDVGWHSA